MTGRPVIGLCTDSSAQLPLALAERYGVEVVPLTVVVDDVEHLEGVDLDVDQFYARFGVDHRPAVSTSQPSPGQFAVAFDDLAARGCTGILSVHSSSALSGTINAARLAARCASVPVRLVDSGTVGFGVSACVLAAAEAIEAGACLDDAARAIDALTPMIGNAFVTGAHGPTDAVVEGEVGGVPVLTLRDGKVDVLERVGTIDAAIKVMAAFLTGWGDDLRVALGHSGPHTATVTAALDGLVRASSNVTEVIDYRVGPSVSMHTGPSTVGAFVFPGRSAGVEQLSASIR